MSDVSETHLHDVNRELKIRNLVTAAVMGCDAASVRLLHEHPNAPAGLERLRADLTVTTVARGEAEDAEREEKYDEAFYGGGR